MEPQAILGRALRFFTMDVYKDTDELDDYEYAAFCINNSKHFSLRHYKNDPAKTTSLYTEPMGQVEAVDIVKTACRSFGIKESVLHWLRGQSFVYGKLEPLSHELLERESRDVVLKAASCFPDHRATTAQIKDFVENLVEFSETDQQPYPSRPTEPRWRQKIGNVVSHAPSARSIFNMGLAKKTAADEIQVTRKGLDYLQSIGFSLVEARL